MKVPLLDLAAHHAPIREELMAAIADVVDSNYFVLGPKVVAFEERVAEYSNVKHAVGVSSGTDALLMALMALDVGRGTEVITTPYSFFATAGCVSRLGAKPVFVDIDEDTYNIDPSLIEAAITPATKAIIPVDLYGQCADVEAVMEIGREHNLAVIEDAAQSIGAQTPQGHRAGSIVTMGCFSFFPSKNLGAFGDGGMVVTNDDELAEKLRRLRAHGAKPKYYHALLGGNFRLDAIQAAILDVKMNRLDECSEARRENARRYTQMLSEAIEGTDLPIQLSRQFIDGTGYDGHVFNQYVVKVDRRDELRAALKKNGIGNEVYYPVPFHLQEVFADLGYKEGDFPLAEYAADHSVAIPVYPELTVEQQQVVVDAVVGFYQPATTSTKASCQTTG